jgi:hypothetical protein
MRSARKFRNFVILDLSRLLVHIYLFGLSKIGCYLIVQHKVLELLLQRPESDENSLKIEIISEKDFLLTNTCSSSIRLHLDGC